MNLKYSTKHTSYRPVGTCKIISALKLSFWKFAIENQKCLPRVSVVKEFGTVLQFHKYINCELAKILKFSVPNKENKN